MVNILDAYVSITIFDGEPDHVVAHANRAAAVEHVVKFAAEMGIVNELAADISALTAGKTNSLNPGQADVMLYILPLGDAAALVR